MKPTLIADLVTRTGDLVAEHYVFPDLGARIRDLLADRSAAGAYADATDPERLAELVTADLQVVNGDRHLRLKFHPEPIPDVDDEAAQVAIFTRQAAETMGGISCVRRLPGGIAHLQLGPILFPLELAADQLIGAMHLVAAADALVLDLREVVGGAPETAAFLISYLVDEPTHLLTMHPRVGEPRQSWTFPFVPGPRFGSAKPVVVLCGGTTFSGGEELTYDLQQLGRATVVGERTGGGAHPRKGYRLHPHLEATVPTARAVGAVSGGNWEGTGVVPDVEVPAADALTVALERLRTA